MTTIQKIQKKKEEKNKVLESTRKLFDVRKDIIGFLKKGIFPFKSNVFKTKEEKSKDESEEQSEKESKDLSNILRKNQRI